MAATGPDTQKGERSGNHLVLHAILLGVPGQWHACQCLAVVPHNGVHYGLDPRGGSESGKQMQGGMLRQGVRQAWDYLHG